MKRNILSAVTASALALSLCFGLVFTAGCAAARGGNTAAGTAGARTAAGKPAVLWENDSQDPSVKLTGAADTAAVHAITDSAAVYAPTDSADVRAITDSAAVYASTASSNAGPSTAANAGTSAAAAAESGPFTGAIALYVGSPNALVNGKTVTIDSNPAVAPYIENSRTLMPLRFVASVLGFGVEWREADKSVLLTRGGLTLEFRLGSNIMRNNGKEVVMDAAAAARNDRTFVPIAYVAGAMGLKVTYDRGLVLLDSDRSYDAAADKAFINDTIGRLSGLPFVGGEAGFNALMKDLAEEDAKNITLTVDDIKMRDMGIVPMPEAAAGMTDGASMNAAAVTSAPGAP
ncbi:MAG: copper amine oxidase N-terminal domain-containing protein, partial [Firmicutes bacterium]|nr:copper amine oxidase N-terminal domain-containing protein [Bacillota bacterium]